MAVGLGLLGVILLAVPMVGTAITGADSLALDIMLWAAAIPIGFATPGLPSARTLTRVLACTVVAAMLVFAAPLKRLRSDRTAGLQAEKVEERVAALKELMKAGETNFRSVDLTGADLSGMDLSGLFLDGSTLKNARCIETKFSQNLDDQRGAVGYGYLGRAVCRGAGFFHEGAHTSQMQRGHGDALRLRLR